MRSKAYTGNRLEQQLSEQTAVFLQDHSRNRVEKMTLKLSALFTCYRDGFEKGWQGDTRLEDFLLAHTAYLDIPVSVVQALKTGKADIECMDYDGWLNTQ